MISQQTENILESEQHSCVNFSSHVLYLACLDLNSGFSRLCMPDELLKGRNWSLVVSNDVIGRVVKFIIKKFSQT